MLAAGLLAGTIQVYKRNLGKQVYYQVVDFGYPTNESEVAYDLIEKFFGIVPEPIRPDDEMLAIYMNEEDMTEDLMMAKLEADIKMKRMQ